jgi:hypothetical protein
MDIDAIKRALARASSELVVARAERTISKFRAHGPAYTPDSVALRSRDLGEVLNEQPEFAGNLMISIGGHGWTSATLGIPRLLLEKAESEGFNNAIAWLQRFLNIEEAVAIRILPIWGLDLNEPVALVGNIQLVPISSLPNSPQLASLLNGQPASQESHVRWVGPTSALTVHSCVNPVDVGHL